MPTQVLTADAVVASTNLTGATTTNFAAQDASWAVATANNVATAARVSFPSPSGQLTTGAGLQTFTVQTRKFSANSGNPTAVIELWENGGGAPLTSSSSFSITSTTGQTNTLTFDASLLANLNGSAVEARISTTAAGGGPSVRNSADVGYLGWTADYTAAVTHDGASVLAGTGTLTAAGAVVLTHAGASVLAGSGSLSVTASVAASGTAALSGTGTITVLGSVTKVGATSLSGAGTLAAAGVVEGGAVTHDGAAVLSGTGSLLAAANRFVAGAVGLSGAGGLLSGSSLTTTGSVLLAGAGTLTAAGSTVTEIQGSASLSGTGTFVGAATLTLPGGAVLLGVASLTSSGTMMRAGGAILSGSGNISAAARLVASGAVLFEGIGTLTAGTVVFEVPPGRIVTPEGIALTGYVPPVNDDIDVAASRRVVSPSRRQI